MNDLKDFDLLAIISILIGYENLIENRQQTADNDVQKANDKQAEFLLKEINRKFDEQNKILFQIKEEVMKNESN